MRSQARRLAPTLAATFYGERSPEVAQLGAALGSPSRWADEELIGAATGIIGAAMYPAASAGLPEAAGMVSRQEAVAGAAAGAGAELEPP